MRTSKILLMRPISLVIFFALFQVTNSRAVEFGDAFARSSKSNSIQWFESACDTSIPHVCSQSIFTSSEVSEFLGLENTCSIVALSDCRQGSNYACEMFHLHTQIRKAAHWAFRPISIGSATSDIIDYLRIKSRMQGRELQAISGKQTPRLAFTISRIKAAMMSMPNAILSAFGRYVSGVFLVENLGPKSETLDLLDEVGLPISGLIVLDVNELQQKANQWLSGRENSPFNPVVDTSGSPDSAQRIEAVLEEGKNNSIENSIQFILLRELGHILFDVLHAAALNSELSKEMFLKRSPFLSLSWFVKEDEFHNKYDQSFAERERPILYIGDPNFRRPIETAEYYYGVLQKSPFPSILATNEIREDFAESFAGYVHGVLQKKPFTIVLKTVKDRVVRTFPSCWDQPVCLTKRKFFDELVASWGRS